MKKTLPPTQPPIDPSSCQIHYPSANRDSSLFISSPQRRLATKAAASRAYLSSALISRAKSDLSYPSRPRIISPSAVRFSRAHCFAPNCRSHDATSPLLFLFPRVCVCLISGWTRFSPHFRFAIFHSGIIGRRYGSSVFCVICVSFWWGWRKGRDRFFVPLSLKIDCRCI